MTVIQMRKSTGRQTGSARDMQATFRRMRAAFKEHGAPTHRERQEHLKKLHKAIMTNQGKIISAISSDFGHRSAHETLLAEIMLTAATVRHARRNLKDWMKPQRRGVGLAFWPAKASVVYQPKGVVGIIAPWNYPFNLAVSPLASALAAGNRVLIKPSEMTPATSKLMKRLIEDIFEPDHVAVITGGPELGQAFSRLPFDHLLYTGSTGVGRQVMRAAAENLTPVTLELGGKSPSIVHQKYPVAAAAKAIMSGKWLNAGQTCIATDYVFVHEDKLDAFLAAAQKETAKLYPKIKNNRDYTAINSDRHFARLKGHIDDARKKGAEIVEINPGRERMTDRKRKIFPTLVVNPTENMTVLKEEIFGPVLPIKTYENIDEVIAYINDRPRPLALYYFDHSKRRIRHLLERTISGGVAINETVFHFAVDNLPFGGVGASGMGAVHANGFEVFSHHKAVFHQSRLNFAFLLRPPFTVFSELVLKTLTHYK